MAKPPRDERALQIRCPNHPKCLAILASYKEIFRCPKCADQHCKNCGNPGVCARCRRGPMEDKTPEPPTAKQIWDRAWADPKRRAAIQEQSREYWAKKKGLTKVPLPAPGLAKSKRRPQ
jgi:hypothetical protein